MQKVWPLLACLMATAGCVDETAPEGPVAMRALEQGVETGHDALRRDALYTEEEWSAWVASHQRSDGSLIARPSPDIDWSRETVLAVTTGPLSSSCGEEIALTRATVRDGVLEAEVTTRPGGAACRAASSHPFAIVAVEHRGPVVFVDAAPPE